MRDTTMKFGRRELIKSAALVAVASRVQAQTQTPPPDVVTTVVNVPLTTSNTVTVERRDDIVLVGINRTFIQNRIDPPTRLRLNEVMYLYEHDPTLRAFVLFGHGENFSRGIDVDAAQAGLVSGQRATSPAPTLDLVGNTPPHRTKPMVVVVHGDTWNLGHEIYLSSDVRVAAANTRFGQDENTHGRFPGGGATVRFVREAGWGNAMRYMLTGDHWTAEESYRMGVTQQIAPTPQAALEAGVVLARKIAACAPLGIRATLASARQVIDPVEADALSKLGAQYAALYRTEDFIEGRKAEAEGRPPKYRGK
jgi:enoyl-CoA hydratase